MEQEDFIAALQTHIPEFEVTKELDTAQKIIDTFVVMLEEQFKDKERKKPKWGMKVVS